MQKVCLPISVTVLNNSLKHLLLLWSFKRQKVWLRRWRLLPYPACERCLYGFGDAFSDSAGPKVRDPQVGNRQLIPKWTLCIWRRRCLLFDSANVTWLSTLSFVLSYLKSTTTTYLQGEVPWNHTNRGTVCIPVPVCTWRDSLSHSVQYHSAVNVCFSIVCCLEF
jgi:hypothetical protein